MSFRSSSSAHFPLWAGLILLLAVGLRFYDSGSEALWLDEGYSWWDARQSWGHLWEMVPQCDPHPPLYVVLLKLWVQGFGDSSVALRALGGVAGVLATGFVILAGREIQPRLGLWAGAFFAAMPFQVEFAHEARPYALVSLGAALLCFGVLRLFRQMREVQEAAGGAAASSRRVAWLALILGLLLLLWTNNTAIFTALALALLLFPLCWREPQLRPLWRPLLAAAVLVLLLWLPYVPTLMSQAQGVSSDFWIPRPDLWRLGNELRFVVGLGSFLILWLVGALALVGVVQLRRLERGREALLLAGLVLLPVLISFFVSRVATPVFLARALIGIAPPFALLVGAAFTTLVSRRLAVGLMGLLLLAQCLTILPLYTRHPRKEPWPDMAGTLAAVAEVVGPGRTLVLLVPNELALPLAHALGERAAGLELQGLPGNFPQPGLAARYPSGKCAPSLEGMDLAPILARAQTFPRVVLITRSNNVYDPGNRMPDLLQQAGLRLERLQQFSPGFFLVYQFVGRTAAAP